MPAIRASGWDSVTNAKVMGEEVGREGWAFLALGGTILTLVSAVFALASPKTIIAWALLLTGGVLAVSVGMGVL